MSKGEGDVALRCAWALVDRLAAAGVGHACVSPGSRSTPIALALWRHPAIRVHVHLDERSSAFFALGIAKATQAPVAVACTSGTAAAELLPAVVEAWMSRAPLLLLTADRPAELRGVGANQTIDQAHLYGRFVKSFVDAPVPGDDPREETWRDMGDDLARISLEHPPGPAHLNLPFREPLVPTTYVDLEPGPQVDRRRGWFGRPDELDAFVDDLDGEERGAILVGTLRRAAPAIVELGRRLSWPVFAEPTSGLRVPGVAATGQLLLANEAFVASHRPRLVVQFGAAPTSRAGLAFSERASRLVIVDPDGLVANPSRRAAWTIRTDPEALAAGALERLGTCEASDWSRAWSDADGRAATAVAGALDALDEPFEGRVARDVASSLPDGSTLVIGSSMPVRDLDAFMLPRAGLRVLANRGASGIDGFVSTTLGVAATGTPTTALCGDLTLLHDVGAVLWSARRGLDATFVVPNNEGGVIFSFLEQRDLPELRELFTTPHGLDLSAICAAAGAWYHRVERARDLVRETELARGGGGVHVVEVPIDAASNVRRHQEVHAAVAEALA